MTARPTTIPAIRARELNLYRRYYDLVASGRKKIEVRVRLRPRVAVYSSFEQMIDTEGPASVNPDSPREQQLANVS